MSTVSPSHAGTDAIEFLRPPYVIDEVNYPDSARHLQGDLVNEIIAMITAQQYAGLQALQAGII